jgi:endogenous inhibitor of DNA gyrase (YacG/DUF329 family)
MTSETSQPAQQHTKALTVECPTCSKPVQWGEQSPSRPFCSERCRLIDLGEWASEGHRISGEHTYTDTSPDN